MGGSSTAELQVAGTPRNRVLGTSGAASGLGSKLNISPSTYVMRLRSTQAQCPSSALICPKKAKKKAKKKANKKAKKKAKKCILWVSVKDPTINTSSMDIS